jgi:hypothetical protein
VGESTIPICRWRRGQAPPPPYARACVATKRDHGARCSVCADVRTRGRTCVPSLCMRAEP